MFHESELQAQEFKRLLEGIERLLKTSENVSVAQKRVKIREAEFLAQRCRTTRDAWKLEIDSIVPQGDASSGTASCPPQEIAAMRARLEKDTKAFRSIMEDLEYRKTELDRNQLTTPIGATRKGDASGGTDGGGENPFEKDADELDDMMSAQLISKGDEVQKKAFASVERARRLVAEAEEIGGAVATKMDAQTEQMERIHGDINTIQNDIERAKKTMKSIAKNAAGDRCIQVICGLIFLAVATMIILAIIGKDGGKFNVPDEVKIKRR